MIYDQLANFEDYRKLAPEVWQKIRTFLDSWTPSMPLGKQVLIEGKLTVSDAVYTTRKPADSKVESHARFADIQIVMEGCENMTCMSTEKLPVLSPMDQEQDYALFSYAEGNNTRLAMVPGVFALLLPGEGHMPGWSDNPAPVRKLVFKIAGELLR